MALLGCMNVVKAEDAPAGLVTIPDGLIQRGGYGYVSVMVNNLPEKSYNGFGVKVQNLPAGISFVDIQILDDETGYDQPTASMGDNTGIIFSLAGTEEDEEGGGSGEGSEEEKETAMFKAGSYQLCKLVFKATTSVALGDVEIEVAEMSLSGADGLDYAINIPSFKLTVTDAIRVLDESSPNSPMNTPGTATENVKVLRTIKAGTWSTLCLPFDVTKTQRSSWPSHDIAEISEFSIEDDVIHLNFESGVSKINANQLYLIRTEEPMEGFEIKKNVNCDHPKSIIINSDDEEMTIDFVGVYYKQNIPEEGIFLNGNSFYYSTGKSTIKGFRGYFVLSDGARKIVFGDGTSSDSPLSNISITVDNELTAVEGISNNYRNNDDVYSVSGVYMGKASDMKKYSRGVYIVNGKKVIVK